MTRAVKTRAIKIKIPLDESWEEQNRHDGVVYIRERKGSVRNENVYLTIHEGEIDPVDSDVFQKSSLWCFGDGECLEVTKCTSSFVPFSFQRQVQDDLHLKATGQCVRSSLRSIVAALRAIELI